MNDDQTYEVSGFEGDSSPDIYGEPDGLEGDTRESHDGGPDSGGVPEGPEAYTIDVPDGIAGDEDMIAGFRNAAHRAKLSHEQVSELVDWYNGFTNGIFSQADQSFEQSLSDLRRQYGHSFESNITAAVNLTEELEAEIPGFKQWLNSTQVGNDPTFIRAFVALAKRAGQSGSKQGGANRDEFGRGMLHFPSMAKK